MGGAEGEREMGAEREPARSCTSPSKAVTLGWEKKTHLEQKETQAGQYGCPNVPGVEGEKVS